MVDDTNYYLDLIKSEYKIETETDLATVLGCAYSTLRCYRKRSNYFDTKRCFKVAGLLDIDPLPIICAMNYHRAHTEARKAFWLIQWRRYSE